MLTENELFSSLEICYWSSCSIFVCCFDLDSSINESAIIVIVATCALFGFAAWVGIVVGRRCCEQRFRIAAGGTRLTRKKFSLKSIFSAVKSEYENLDTLGDESLHTAASRKVSRISSFSKSASLRSSSSFLINQENSGAENGSYL